MDILVCNSTMYDLTVLLSFYPDRLVCRQQLVTQVRSRLQSCLYSRLEFTLIHIHITLYVHHATIAHRHRLHDKTSHPIDSRSSSLLHAPLLHPHPLILAWQQLPMVLDVLDQPAGHPALSLQASLSLWFRTSGLVLHAMTWQAWLYRANPGRTIAYIRCTMPCTHTSMRSGKYISQKTRHMVHLAARSAAPTHCRVSLDIVDR